MPTEHQVVHAENHLIIRRQRVPGGWLYITQASTPSAALPGISLGHMLHTQFVPDSAAESAEIRVTRKIEEEPSDAE